MTNTGSANDRMQRTPDPSSGRRAAGEWQRGRGRSGARLARALTLVAAGIMAVPTKPVYAQGEASLATALVGTWAWTLPDGSCTESQSYRADGTGSVTSGDERSEQTWRVEAVEGSPLARMIITTTRDDRGKDCIGQDIDDTGRTVTLYYRIDGGGGRLVFCFDLQQDQCFGPFFRQRII